MKKWKRKKKENKNQMRRCKALILRTTAPRKKKSTLRNPRKELLKTDLRRSRQSETRSKKCAQV